MKVRLPRSLPHLKHPKLSTMRLGTGTAELGGALNTSHNRLQWPILNLSCPLGSCCDWTNERPSILFPLWIFYPFPERKSTEKIIYITLFFWNRLRWKSELGAKLNLLTQLRIKEKKPTVPRSTPTNQPATSSGTWLGYRVWRYFIKCGFETNLTRESYNHWFI